MTSAGTKKYIIFKGLRMSRFNSGSVGDMYASAKTSFESTYNTAKK